VNTPTPTPPPFGSQQAIQHASLMRALTGPLLLTTLGILLAVDHMGGVSFGRTWPALLIVFGICKIAEVAGGKNR